MTDLHTEYDERTFRSLLNLEHRRCRHSGQDFHVLLCRLATYEGAPFRIQESVKRALISAVQESLRKTDYVGWFLQDLVLGAILLKQDSGQTDLPSGRCTNQIRRQIEDRLSSAYPSVVFQFYDYLDLPPVQQHVGPRGTDRALIRHD